MWLHLKCLFNSLFKRANLLKTLSIDMKHEYTFVEQTMKIQKRHLNTADTFFPCESAFIYLLVCIQRTLQYRTDSIVIVKLWVFYDNWGHYSKSMKQNLCIDRGQSVHLRGVVFKLCYQKRHTFTVSKWHSYAFQPKLKQLYSDVHSPFCYRKNYTENFKI